MIINEHLREIYENLLHIDESIKKFTENVGKHEKVKEDQRNLYNSVENFVK